MKTLLSTSGFVSLVLLILLCALCEVSLYKIDPSEKSCASSTRYGKHFKRAILLRSKTTPKQNNQNKLTFFMIGMPVHNIKDYESEVELQMLQGNYALPSVSDNQLQNIIEQLMEPKFGLCWTLSGSISSFAKGENGKCRKRKKSAMNESILEETVETVPKKKRYIEEKNKKSLWTLEQNEGYELFISAYVSTNPQLMPKHQVFAVQKEHDCLHGLEYLKILNKMDSDLQKYKRQSAV